MVSFVQMSKSNKPSNEGCNGNCVIDIVLNNSSPVMVLLFVGKSEDWKIESTFKISELVPLPKKFTISLETPRVI